MEGLARRLEGERVVLEPLPAEHAEGLWQAAQAPEIWRWLPHLDAGRDRFDRWFEGALASTAAGGEAVFAVRERPGDGLCGSSRFLNVRPEDRVVEIGWTWFNPSAWGRGINVEAKLLMLEHAFDGLGCVRVEFKTDARNERSRAAIAAIPAQFEGVLRKHRIQPDVGVRDSAFYSVIDEEWPAVRGNLERCLAGGRGAP